MEECQNLNLNGYSDWYLPTKIDLKLLYNQKHVIPGLSGDYYWSSTVNEYNAEFWFFVFPGGYTISNNKAWIYYVRAVRAF